MRDAFILYTGSSSKFKRQLALSLFLQGKCICLPRPPTPPRLMFMSNKTFFPLESTSVYISLVHALSEGVYFLSRLRVITWLSTNYSHWWYVGELCVLPSSVKTRLPFLSPFPPYPRNTLIVSFPESVKQRISCASQTLAAPCPCTE